MDDCLISSKWGTPDVADYHLPGDCREAEAISVSTTAIGPTTTKIRRTTSAHATIVEHAKEALFTVETDYVRFRFDNTAPTSTVGHRLAPGDSITVKGYDNIRRLQFIRSSDSAATATVFASYMLE